MHPNWKNYSLNLNLTKRYKSYSDLKKDPPKCDVCVCGSDQIWNQYFTMNGEGGLTLSYFLNFGVDDIKRIAYAVSFGTIDYPDELMKVLKYQELLTLLDYLPTRL